MHTIIGVALKTNFMSSLLYFLRYAFSSITPKILNLHNKSPKIFSLICLVLNAVLIPISHVKAVQDDISSKTIRL